MEKEFNFILQNIHNEIPKELTRKIKDYIYKNQDNETVKVFIYRLIHLYKEYFDSNEVINALNIPEQFIYLKKQEISKVLPSQNLLVNLFNILEYPDYYGSLKGFFELCILLISSIPNSEETIERINKLLYFTENNKCIIRGSKDDYEDLNSEINYYENALKGNFNNPNYEQFKMISKISAMPTEDEIQRNYIYKKLGNIGELHTIMLLEYMNFPEIHLIAKELGNGYGYDIYFQGYKNHEKPIEVLLEVKTTTSHSDNDTFIITKNEYDILMETLDNPNAEYLICRKIYDDDVPILLSYKDGQLISERFSEDNIAYELIKKGNDILAKRITKKSILKLTKKED